jgi:hypothetical protein
MEDNGNKLHKQLKDIKIVLKLEIVSNLVIVGTSRGKESGSSID